VALGVRPEDLTLDGSGPGVSLEGVVDVREPLGSEVLVHLETPVGPLVARHPGQRVPEEGGRVRVRFTYDKLYCFDPDTELALKGAD
jgi:multiple sugar transport system ATP-binding protein